MSEIVSNCIIIIIYFKFTVIRLKTTVALHSVLIPKTYTL
jgi:hypothetical protein